MSTAIFIRTLRRWSGSMVTLTSPSATSTAPVSNQLTKSQLAIWLQLRHRSQNRLMLSGASSCKSASKWSSRLVRRSGKTFRSTSRSSRVKISKLRAIKSLVLSTPRLATSSMNAHSKFRTRSQANTRWLTFTSQAGLIMGCPLVNRRMNSSSWWWRLHALCRTSIRWQRVMQASSSCIAALELAVLAPHLQSSMVWSTSTNMQA